MLNQKPSFEIIGYIKTPLFGDFSKDLFLSKMISISFHFLIPECVWTGVCNSKLIHLQSP